MTKNKLYKNLLGGFKMNIKAILLPLFLLPYISCKKFVTAAPPVTVLTAGSVYEDAGTATGAQLGIYKGIFNSNTYNWNVRFGMMADELQSYSSAGDLPFVYANALTATNNDEGLFWSTQYNFIYQANAVIENLGASKSISGPIKNQLTGEALFVRAFWHFYLSGWYGDIPLVITTDYKVNGPLARSSQNDVYLQIIKDLQAAKGLLNSNYVDKSDTAITTERVRPNIATAEALLARTFLFTKNYDSAEAEASLVIGNSLYTLEPNLSNVFLVSSQEAIWQLETPQPNGINTHDAEGFILIAVPSSDYNNCSTISPQLMASFEAGDNRQISWIGIYTDNTVSPAVNYYFPYKYKAFQTGTVSEYTMILRLAEQYLIRAEARAQQGNTAGALSDLNAIRNRAGLADYAGATDQASLIAAILHEKQVELFTEWGHRWMDLVRTGNANTVMSVVCPQKGGMWYSDGHQQLFPIPQSERDKDHNLTQNPGY